MDIGNKIKSLRLKAGITQETLASEMGVSCQSISKWENNVCAPDISLLPQLSEFFGVTIDELFDLSTNQKLKRIENMLDFEAEISDSKFRDTERFLLSIIDTYNNDYPDQLPGRIETFLSHLYNHRVLSDSKKVSEYARCAIRKHPGLNSDHAQFCYREDHAQLCYSENSARSDWSFNHHTKTINFYKEIVNEHPEIGMNYLYLLNNLLADHRTVEAAGYLEMYSKLEKHQDFYVKIYRFRLALAEFKIDEAMQILVDMEKESPDDPATLFELADAYASLCEYDKAVTLFDKSYVLEPNPKHQDALWGIATIYEIQGKYDKTLEVYDRILTNMLEEWHITEGAPIDEIIKEKERVATLM